MAEHTGGMIALIPREQDLAALAVDGGDPVDQLHLTLAYLGDDVRDWPEGYAEKLRERVAEEAGRWPSQKGRVFAHAAFNPDGGPDGDRDPCAVYLVGDNVGLSMLRTSFGSLSGQVLGDGMMPEQHEPFVPHITAGYGLELGTLEHTGPVVFDRVRLALAGENYDFPLEGDDPDEPEVEDDTEEEGTVPELTLANEQAIRLPVMAVEGWETSDGRFIEPGALTHRALPIPILAQTVNPVGGDGHDGAEIIGRVDSMTKVPGPEVINKQTGEPFPEGTFVWSGEGVIDSGSAGGLAVSKRYLTGNSIDLAEIEVEYRYERDDDVDEEIAPGGKEQTVVTKGVIAATTLCAIPAFGEAYVELGGEALVAAADIPAQWVTEKPVPMWRSGEIDDQCAPCSAGLVASGAADEDLPPASAFVDPQLDGPTPLTIGEPDPAGYRMVRGHLATWGTCHIGFAGQCITPPRSSADYAYFRTGAVRVVDESGAVFSVAVGHLTVGDKGHAAMSDSASAAVEHYDVTGTAVADVAAGEDEHGIWVAGVVRPDVPEAKVRELAASALSGDWRRIRGNLELVAALAVNVPGFPVPRARVASGTPTALVAAGAVEAPRSNGAVVLDYDTLADALAERLEARAVQRQEQLAARKQAALLSIRRDAALAELAKGKKGGGPIPPYMKRIAKHLMKEEGYDESRAIATAVNAAKKMCATGDTNWPGKQQVNPGSRAEACTAVAQWEKRNAG